MFVGKRISSGRMGEQQGLMTSLASITYFIHERAKGLELMLLKLSQPCIVNGQPMQDPKHD